MMAFLWTVWVLLLTVGITLWAMVAVFVRRMVSWQPRRRFVTVLGVDASQVHLERGPIAESPGVFTLSWMGGSALAGNPTVTPAGISRDLHSLSGTVPVGKVAVSPDPGVSPEVGGEFTEVSFPSEAGDVPAWLYGPASSTWVIHVHGVRSNRLHTLWSVPAAAAAGMTSLVIAYRGAPGGPRQRRAGMGIPEAEDVASAIDFAVQSGAERIVLSGWSMGASACLLASERTTHQSRIAGFALVAPTLSWRHVMRAGAKRLSLPSWVCRLVEAAITTPVVARLVGMPVRVDLDALDWVTPLGRLQKPALVFGSREDSNVPFEILTAWEERNPGLVELHEFGARIHGWEPNVNPEKFQSIMSQWLRACARPEQSSAGPSS